MGVRCGLCVESRLEGGVKSRPEVTETWTRVMTIERKEG